MDKDKKENPDKKKPMNELDNELNQTFPASDPPSHTRPRRDRQKEEKEKEEGKD